VTRNLLGDRLAFDFVGVEQCRVSPPLYRTRQHPRQVHGVGDPRIHPVACKRHPDMRGIATQENTPVPKTVGDHAPPGPVRLTENLELERGTHAQDLPNAAIAVDG
jgi:hypothetical protein